MKLYQFFFNIFLYEKGIVTYLNYLDMIKRNHNTKMIKNYCNKIYYLYIVFYISILIMLNFIFFLQIRISIRSYTREKLWTLGIRLRCLLGMRYKAWHCARKPSSRFLQNGSTGWSSCGGRQSIKSQRSERRQSSGY